MQKHHPKVCHPERQGGARSRRRFTLESYLESYLPHHLEPGRLKAEIGAEWSKVTKLSCDVESAENNYEVSYQQHLSILKSLSGNVLEIADWKLCWINPESQSWKPADRECIKKHHGVVFEPHCRVRLDTGAEADAKYHKKVIEEYIDKKRYDRRKANGAPFVFMHIPKAALELGRPLVDVPTVILFRLLFLDYHLARNDTFMMCVCRGGIGQWREKISGNGSDSLK